MCVCVGVWEWVGADVGGYVCVGVWTWGGADVGGYMGVCVLIYMCNVVPCRVVP